jgi:Na+/phosphate symporter
MSFQNLKILFLFVVLLASASAVNAQISAASASGRPDDSKEDYPEGFKESFAKMRLKAAEKEFDEMVGRSEEAAKISDELYESYQEHQKLMPQDAKKVERLEKLIKKIRDDLGSESGDDKNNQSNESLISFGDALKNIRETSSDLFSELKKRGRFTVSVVAVESSNTLLKLVRFVRQKPN